MAGSISNTPEAVPELPSFDPVPIANRPGKRRKTVGWAVCLVVLAAVGAALLFKGTGLKTWIVFHLEGKPMPHRHNYLRSGLVVNGTPDPEVRFEKIMLPVASGASFTCVAIGPGHALYASSDDGRLFRFAIHTDGQLDPPTVFTSLQKAEGGKRLVTGFCFDPASTVQNPILWVSHGYYGFHDVPDWSGKLSRISGNDLQKVQTILVNLPRSVRDHLNNQPAFGPDGALYFPQGSNSAYGAPDIEWGDRPEHMLNASILRLDVKRLDPDQPLDVRTRDGGGSYDPYAMGAPLTIYCGGVRNAFDLVWADNGSLYVPVNGSNSGGNTPAGAGTTALFNLPEAEDDWLLRVTPGKYYGHPNPQQGHFVLNGGNPANRHRMGEVPEYPAGTQPDPDYEKPIFTFGLHASANGIIQYHGNAFGGKLDHKLIVCRYNLNDDLICLGLNAAGDDVESIQTDNVGFTKFASPLDLTEDLSNGNLYVAEYGGQRITLLRPLAPNVSPNVTAPPPTEVEPEKTRINPHQSGD